MPLGIQTPLTIDQACLDALWAGEAPVKITERLGLPSSTQVCRNAGREAFRRLAENLPAPNGPGPVIAESGALGPGCRCNASKGDEALEMKLNGDTLTVICNELGWRYEGAASTAIARAAIRALATRHED